MFVGVKPTCLNSRLSGLTKFDCCKGDTFMSSMTKLFMAMAEKCCTRWTIEQI